MSPFGCKRPEDRATFKAMGLEQSFRETILTTGVKGNKPTKLVKEKGFRSTRFVIPILKRKTKF